jgi:hypothetical protein
MSRSGLSAKHGIDVRARTSDADYRGSVMVKLENSSTTPFEIKQGIVLHRSHCMLSHNQRYLKQKSLMALHEATRDSAAVESAIPLYDILIIISQRIFSMNPPTLH